MSIKKITTTIITSVIIGAFAMTGIVSSASAAEQSNETISSTLIISNTTDLSAGDWK